MHRKISSMSDSWTCSRKSRRPTNLFNSQEFEKVDSLNTSFDTGKIKSLLIPQQSSDNVLSHMRRGETVFEKIKNMGTNLRFKIGTLGENIWPEDSNKHKAYLLGKEYEIEKLEHIKKMKEDFEDIIWFSYRKNFPTLNYRLIPLSESFVSDTGWGCMIRVCQMIFAECLKRHIIERKTNIERKRSNISDQTHLEVSEHEKKELNYEVISWFLDAELDPKASPYSIQNLSIYLHEKFKLKPGIWLKPSSVLFALQEIHSDYGQATAPELQIEIYIESTIYVTQALKKVTYAETSSENSFDKAFAEEFEVVEDNASGEDEENDEENNENVGEQPIEFKSDNKEENEENGDAAPSPIAEDVENVDAKEENLQGSGDDSLESIYINDAKEIDKLLIHKWRDSLVIFILAKIGLDKPNPQYLPFIKDLLSYPESVGMIGGKPGLAYYIVGFAEDKLMYLDPHFVQESVQSREDLRDNIQTYFTNTIRHVGFNDIDTSLTFGFFIKDEVTFKSFLNRFRQSCQTNESFLGVELNAPQENTTDVESVCEEYGEEKKVRDEDGFEML